MKELLLFALIALLAVTACKKKTSDPESDPAPTTTTTTGTTGTTTVDPATIGINSVSQVYFSFGGTTVSQISDGTYYSSFGNGGGFTPTTHLKYFSSVLSNVLAGKHLIEITRNMVVPTSGTIVSDSEFNALFSLASIPYSEDTVNGVQIKIRDANDVLWGTNYGTRDQTGSTFSIVQTKDDHENFPFSNNGNYIYLKTYITFSCKVYNYNTGEMKVITNGKYVGHFSNY